MLIHMNHANLIKEFYMFHLVFVKVQLKYDMMILPYMK